MSAGAPGSVAADLLVLGGGLAGAVAALTARERGARVALVRRAPGASALSSGGLGVAWDAEALPGEALRSRRGWLESARRLAARQPEHPYAVLGEALEALPAAVAFTARELGALLAPPLERNRFLATANGAALGCALCQRGMVAGDLLEVPGKLAVADFRGHLGWDSRLVAGGLAAFAALGGPEPVALQLDLFTGPGQGLLRPHELARALEPPGAAEEAGRRLREALPAGAGAALLPPVLGLDPAARVPERLASAAGLPVAELLSDVPSVPGLRLQAALDERLRAAGVELVEGAVERAEGPGEPLLAGGREVTAATWVLATGRFTGGGVVRRGALREPVLGLPVHAGGEDPAGPRLHSRPPAALTQARCFGPQPLLAAGLRVDRDLRPLGEDGRPVHPRLLAAGAVIGGHEPAQDGTGLGVALLTGWLAGRVL
ncbi:MAG TPA: FAD-binding protein [Anaeromyxobacteraceae bacterium]|jgi:glycerol-3-phosphate dehydrogenase subunit B|nr:FAD-binding protein [Anaeromyxobacteraceae bacterium]